MRYYYDCWGSEDDTKVRFSAQNGQPASLRQADAKALRPAPAPARQRVDTRARRELGCSRDLGRGVLFRLGIDQQLPLRSLLTSERLQVQNRAGSLLLVTIPSPTKEHRAFPQHRRGAFQPSSLGRLERLWEFFS